MVTVNKHMIWVLLSLFCTCFANRQVIIKSEKMLQFCSFFFPLLFCESGFRWGGYFKDIINLYFTKFAVICLSPSISPSNQHINGCFILTENWYALPMVFFLLLGTQNKMTRYHILKYLGPKACQSTCSYLFWSRNI